MLTLIKGKPYCIYLCGWKPKCKLKQCKNSRFLRDILKKTSINHEKTQRQNLKVSARSQKLEDSRWSFGFGSCLFLQNIYEVGDLLVDVVDGSLAFLVNVEDPLLPAHHLGLQVTLPLFKSHHLHPKIRSASVDSWWEKWKVNQI